MDAKTSQEIFGLYRSGDLVQTWRNFSGLTLDERAYISDQAVRYHGARRLTKGMMHELILEARESLRIREYNHIGDYRIEKPIDRIGFIYQSCHSMAGMNWLSVISGRHDKKVDIQFCPGGDLSILAPKGFRNGLINAGFSIYSSFAEFYKATPVVLVSSQELIQSITELLNAES